MMRRLLRASSYVLIVGLIVACGETEPVVRHDGRLAPPPTSAAFDGGTAGEGTGSCAGKCGSDDAVGGCYCNAACVQYGDCCADYATVCGGSTTAGSCAGQCGSDDAVGGCYCNAECVQYGDCCPDYATACPGS